MSGRFRRSACWYWVLDQEAILRTRLVTVVRSGSTPGKSLSQSSSVDPSNQGPDVPICSPISLCKFPTLIGKVRTTIATGPKNDG